MKEEAIESWEARNEAVDAIVQKMLEFRIDVADRWSLFRKRECSVVLNGKTYRAVVDGDIYENDFSIQIALFDDEANERISMFCFTLKRHGLDEADIYHREVIPRMRRQGLASFNLDVIKAFLREVSKKNKTPIDLHLATVQKEVARTAESNDFIKEPEAAEPRFFDRSGIRRDSYTFRIDPNS